MRTGVSEQSAEHWPPSLVVNPHYERWQRERTRQFSIMASGFEQSTPRAYFMLSRTSTFTSRIESWCLNLSSRGVKVLNVSYWIFMVLCCITFFTSHWSLFLAFLIPALALNLLRVLRNLWKTASSCRSGASTNGT